jgi:hypothetical protein
MQQVEILLADGGEVATANIIKTWIATARDQSRYLRIPATIGNSREGENHHRYKPVDRADQCGYSRDTEEFPEKCGLYLEVVLARNIVNESCQGQA